MKKLILLLLLAAPLIGSAQWVGTNPVYFNAGNVGIGTSTPATRLELVNSAPATVAPSTIKFTTYTADPNLISLFKFQRSAGTLAAPTNLVASDLIFTLAGAARINAAFQDVANIQMGVGTAPGATSYPGFIRFNTVATNTTTMAERMRLSDVGNLGIGIVPTERLHVAGGNVVVTSGYVSASGNLTTAANLLTAGGILNANSTNPLLFQTNGTERVRILSTSGFMGVGNIVPTEMLHVNGNAKVVGSITGSTNIVLDNATPILYTGTGASELNRYLRISNSSGTSTPSGLMAGGVLVADSYTYASPSKNDLIVKGKVGIGTAFTGANANNYILAVNGKIGAKDVQIEATANPWPDYVFTSTYKLPSLFELEMYILANKHLPEVPSAKEVNENGYSVSELDATLLKKVEELTLYLIEQQKQINALRAELEKNKK